jgi:hypothetical protein
VVAATVALAVVGVGAALAGANGVFRGTDEQPVAKSDSQAMPSPSQPRTGSRDSGEVRVQVLNASGKDGVARNTATILTEAGYEVVRVQNTESNDRTVVRHSARRATEAKSLAAGVPGAVLEEDQALGGAIELILGKGFEGPVVPTRPTGTTSLAQPLSRTAP